MFGLYLDKISILLEIFDIIDEFMLFSVFMVGGSGQCEILKIFDIIDEVYKQQSNVKELILYKEGLIVISKLLISKDVGLGMGVGLIGLLDGILVFGKLGDKKILLKLYDVKVKGREYIVVKERFDKEKKKLVVYKFIGNIIIDGCCYFIMGIESEELDLVIIYV